jgi:membrane-associated phospholipid phosphatase
MKPVLIAALLLAAALVITGGFLLDAPVEKAVRAANGGHWSHDRLAADVSRYGDWPELMLAGGLGYLLARRAGSVKWQRLLLSAMIASTLAGAVVNVSRLTTGRTRPRAEAAQGWYGPRHDGHWLIGKADFNSFPSGHTATAVGFAGVLLFGAPAWGALAACTAMGIALSRILLGAHHPSDVLTAAALSLAVAWAVWEFLGKQGRLDFRKRN